MKSCGVEYKDYKDQYGKGILGWFGRFGTHGYWVVKIKRGGGIERYPKYEELSVEDKKKCEGILREKGL